MRQTRMRALATLLTTAALVVGFAPSAHAVTDEEAASQNLYNNENCNIPGASKFKFHIYYNSGLNGSYDNIGYSVYDFDALRPGDGYAHPLTFCMLGASSPWPGSGQHIKNNAAGGENTHYKYYARVYYHSGYKGAQDVIDPYQHHDQFTNVYNENASFKWTSR